MQEMTAGISGRETKRRVLHALMRSAMWSMTGHKHIMKEASSDRGFSHPSKRWKLWFFIQGHKGQIMSTGIAGELAT
jgi:hypothetical protein